MSELERTHAFPCPYCGEANAVALDPTGGRRQTFTVDCEVCCQPIVVTLKLGSDGLESFTATPES